MKPGGMSDLTIPAEDVPDAVTAARLAYADALRDAVKAVGDQRVVLWCYPRGGQAKAAIWLDDALAAIDTLREEEK